MKSSFHLDRQNEDIDSRIVAGLERISEVFRVLLWNESKEFSLSPIQIQILIFLDTHSKDKCKISYLAAEFNMTKPTISDAVKSLEEKSLIKRKTDPSDSRSHYIELTGKGKKVAEKSAMFTAELEKPIHLLKDDDKVTLLLNLISIINHLTEAGVITIQRMCMTCVYYKKDDSRNIHFCKLLNKRLKNTELRIDCPEHSMRNKVLT